MRRINSSFIMDCAIRTSGISCELFMSGKVFAINVFKTCFVNYIQGDSKCHVQMACVGSFRSRGVIITQELAVGNTIVNVQLHCNRHAKKEKKSEMNLILQRT